MSIKILLCIPVYNEFPVIYKLIKEIQFLKEKYTDIYIVIINDNSNDGSLELLKDIKDKKFEIISHKKRKGIGGCIHTGLLIAKEKMCSHFCLWPGNMRISGNSVSKIIDFSIKQNNLYKKNLYIHGSRFGEVSNTPLHRKSAIIIFSKMASIISKKKLTDISCGLRFFPIEMIDKKAIISLENSEYKGEQILTIEAIKKGFDICEIGISLVYSKERNYSHLKFYNIYQVIFPWIKFLIEKILNKPSNNINSPGRLEEQLLDRYTFNRQ